MLKLEEIIDAAEGREIKRAIAVKMVLLGFKTKDICDLLEVPMRLSVNGRSSMKMKVPVDCDCITKAALNFNGRPAT